MRPESCAPSLGMLMNTGGVSSENKHAAGSYTLWFHKWSNAFFCWPWADGALSLFVCSLLHTTPLWGFFLEQAGVLKLEIWYICPSYIMCDGNKSTRADVFWQRGLLGDKCKEGDWMWVICGSIHSRDLNLQLWDVEWVVMNSTCSKCMEIGRQFNMSVW